MRKLLLCCLVAAACSGSSISPDDLADEIADAQCDQLVRCEGIQDRATCDASVTLEGSELSTILAGVDDGTIKYDSGAAADCADFISGGSCSFDGFHEKNPCDDVFKGTVPTGGACFTGLQCAMGGDCVQNDGNCDPDTTCCVGTCMGTFTESPIGGPCDDDLHFCPTNSFCKTPMGATSGTCTATINMEGAACDEIDACANPMYCNLSFTTGIGTCKTAAASGATCARTDLLPCADNRDYCDPTMLKCVKSAAVGATCGNGVLCVDYASCIGGTCQADLKAGAACNDTGPDCAGSLECTNGTCQLPPAGMTCALP